MALKQGAGWDSAEPSNSPEISRVTPDMLWCHKGPKQQLVIAMKKGPFLSRPKSLLQCVNCVSAVSLLPVRLHYCNGEQSLIHWLQFSPGFCTKSKCCFTSSNDFGLYVWSCSVKRNCEFVNLVTPKTFLQYDANHSKQPCIHHQRFKNSHRFHGQNLFWIFTLAAAQKQTPFLVCFWRLVWVPTKILNSS